MVDQIVITEKTSQAKDVRTAIGARYGMVLPAEGHLFDLLEPEDVMPEWKRWSPVLLRPQELYGTRPAKGGNKAAKLKAIREALRTAKRVWLATDCDREGQLIGQEILEHYKYQGQVMRVLFTAQDAQTIRQSFDRAPFPKHERGTTVGKNGAFRDGSPRTCNGCNSPDHLFHDCTRQQTSPQMQKLGKHAVVLTKKQAKMAFAALNSMSADAAVGAGEPSSASGSAMAPTTPSQRPSVVSGNVLSQDASGQTASNASRLASLLSTLSSSRDISNRRQ